MPKESKPSPRLGVPIEREDRHSGSLSPEPLCGEPRESWIQKDMATSRTTGQVGSAVEAMRHTAHVRKFVDDEETEAVRGRASTHPYRSSCQLEGRDGRASALVSVPILRTPPTSLTSSDNRNPRRAKCGQMMYKLSAIQIASIVLFIPRTVLSPALSILIPRFAAI